MTYEEEKATQSKLIPQEEYEACETAWLKTLAHFGVERPILPYEKMKLARLIKTYDWKSIVYAVTGMRYEARSESFEPSKNVGLYRLEDSRLLEKFINLAAQAQTKEKKKREGQS